MKKRTSSSKDTLHACLLVKIERPAGATADLLVVTLGERAEQVGPLDGEYPHTPQYVGGLYCAFGELGLMLWTECLNLTCGPSYRHAAFVDATTAQAMVKTLRTLTTKLGKLTEARGYPTSLGERVVRFAEVTGARSIAFHPNAWTRVQSVERPRDGWYFIEAVSYGRHVLDLLARSYAPQAPASAEQTST